MKKYVITIEQADFIGKSNFINDLRNEIGEDKRQEELTRKINRETTVVHTKILKSLIKEVNKTLAEIGLKFENVRLKNGNNSYEKPVCEFLTLRNRYVIEIFGETLPSGNGISKYTTQSGNYSIKIFQGDRNHNSSAQGVTVKNADDVLNRLKSDIKEYMLENA